MKHFIYQFNTYIANEIKLFTLLSRFTVTRHCEVSFPPKTSRICQAKRTLERQPIDKRWNLTKRPFDFMVLNNITRQCEVSLPQKTSLICQRKRVLERQTMKKIWKLTKSPFGFMVLDRTPTEHVFKTFVDPFSRFNMEHYLQTVLTSDLTHSVYNVLVKNVGEIQKDYNYKVLSKYFAMASKLGGVSIISSSRRLW